MKLCKELRSYLKEKGYAKLKDVGFASLGYLNTFYSDVHQTSVDLKFIPFDSE